MSAHTPGPWSVPHFAKPDANCNCKFVLSDGMLGAVASVHCSGDGDDWQANGDNPKFDEAVANAHLIAAAPDLLDALQKIVDMNVQYCIDRHGDASQADGMGCVVIAREAIAKAKGESK